MICVCVHVFIMFCWLICKHTQWGMNEKNNELKPSIDRIQKLPYFDGESNDMKQ